MDLIIYLFLPCAGSIFLLGSMFYGAYRIAAPASRFSGASLFVISGFIIINVACSILGNTWINLLFMLLFPVVAWKVYKVSAIFLIPYVILAVAVFLTDVVVVLVFQMLWVTGILYLNSLELDYILRLVVVRIVEFMVVMLVTMAAGKKIGRHIRRRQVVLSILVPLYSIFNMYCTLYLMQVYMVRESVVLFVLNVIFLIGLNIYFCVLVDIMSENYQLENERNLYRQQAQLKHEYYEEEEEKYEESRKLIHDIRNHIHAMEELYRREEAVDAEHYASNIQQLLNSFQQTYYTSEKLLNIILNDKVQQMRRAGIREDVRIGEIDLSFMREIDITALFGNLLDNAVASAEECNDGYMRLRVNKIHQFLSIYMENSCDKEPEKLGEGFRSHKPGHEGLGIQNIIRTAEQYGGDVQFNWKDGIFYTKIMLCLSFKSDMQYLR